MRSMTLFALMIPAVAHATQGDPTELEGRCRLACDDASMTLDIGLAVAIGGVPAA